MDNAPATPLASKREPALALSMRIRRKLERIYLDWTGPRHDREFRRISALASGVEGWLDPGEQRFLFDSAYKLLQDANIVEVGSFKGRSTCFLASACRGTKKRVFAVDTFNGSDGDYFGHRDFFSGFERNVRHCGVAQYVKPLIGRSGDIAKSWSLPISLLFIDGSHV
jgi:predicted O-methyltransferase YrrM